MTLLHRRTLIASAALLIAGGARAAGAGQRAPDFTLPDTRGKHCRRQARHPNPCGAGYLRRSASWRRKTQRPHNR